jgi:hypothetical protein
VYLVHAQDLFKEIDPMTTMMSRVLLNKNNKILFNVLKKIKKIYIFFDLALRGGRTTPRPTFSLRVASVIPDQPIWGVFWPPPWPLGVVVWPLQGPNQFNKKLGKNTKLVHVIYLIYNLFPMVSK